MAYKKETDIFTQKHKKRWRFVGAGVLGLVLIVVLVFGAVKFAYAEKFYPGVRLDHLTLGGRTRQGVLTELQTIEQKLQQEGLVVSAQDKSITITPIVISTSPDLAQHLLSFDWQQTLDQAWQVGRSGNWLVDAWQIAAGVFGGYRIEVSYQFDEKRFIEHLQANFSGQETPPKNSALLVGNGDIDIIPEQGGLLFNYGKAVDEVKRSVARLTFEPVKLELVPAFPTITRSEALSALDRARELLDAPLLGVNHDGKVWNITKSELASWFEFQRVDGDITIGLNQEKVLAFLQDIAAEINVPERDAKFSLEGNRVREFQSSQDGKKLNLETSYERLNQQLQAGRAGDVSLVVEVQPAKVATADLNDLGIKELLGRGESNFFGSPVNRRHNINVGVDSLNGILIPPGEEFSLIDALGEIDGENGYLKELVIKGNRTIPEYGGGLCQIGSTTFRAALWSGLPITARRNHSYRVRYYEPAGMDATIYDPAPDMKFLNDTGHHILFIAKMEGDDLVFEFYGTPDGRTVDISPNPPTIYNVVQPGPPRYIETEDLPPGEKQKVESAHPGADTYFKYTVTYPDGRVYEQDFYSHYIPWTEVWLVGKEVASTTAATIESISTN